MEAFHGTVISVRYYSLDASAPGLVYLSIAQWARKNSVFSLKNSIPELDAPASQDPESAWRAWISTEEQIRLDRKLLSRGVYANGLLGLLWVSSFTILYYAVRLGQPLGTYHLKGY